MQITVALDVPNKPLKSYRKELIKGRESSKVKLITISVGNREGASSQITLPLDELLLAITKVLADGQIVAS